MKKHLLKPIILLILILTISVYKANSEEVAGVETEKMQTNSVEMLGRTASIKELSGNVTVLKKGAEEWEELKKDTKLDKGDQLSVGNDSKVLLDIDGHTIQLDAGTLFTFRALTNEIELKIWHGRIKAKVKKLSSSELFGVYSPVSFCAVKGTEFDLAVNSDKSTELDTISGLVSMKNLDTGEEMDVPAGKKGIIKSGKKGITISDIKEEEKESKEKTSEIPDGAAEVEKEMKEEKEPEPEKKSKAKSKAPVSSEGKKKGFIYLASMNGSMGADVLVDQENPDNNKIYYSLSLMPELGIWRFGIGFDINLYFDENGNLREEDWDEWEDAVGKILYIRYGMKGDPLYILFGGIRSYSLGNGFILNRYTNMLQYPDVRDKGVIVEIRRNKLGIESIVSNIDSYPVFGGRLYLMPLAGSSIPLLSKASLGVTGVLDNNPDKADRTEDDEVLFYGADFGMPLLNIYPVKTYGYFDVATYSLGDTYNNNSPGKGTATGLRGSIIEIIKFGAEYRKFDRNFIPRYFDGYYEVERNLKPLIIASDVKDPQIEGPVVFAGLSLMNKLDLSVSYEDYNNDPYSLYPYLYGKLTLAPALLMNKFDLSVYYEKKNLNKFSDISELEGAIMTVELGYMIAPRVFMVVTQKQTFNEDGTVNKTMSMQTRFRF